MSDELVAEKLPNWTEIPCRAPECLEKAAWAMKVTFSAPGVPERHLGHYCVAHTPQGLQ